QFRFGFTHVPSGRSHPIWVALPGGNGAGGVRPASRGWLGVGMSGIHRALRQAPLRVASAAAALLLLQAAQAADQTWLGNGTASGNFATGTNWNGGAAPGLAGNVASTDVATFGTSATTTLDVDSTRAIGSLRFSAGAPTYSFNLSGVNTFYIRAGILNDSSNAPLFTISSNAALAVTAGTLANAVVGVAATGGLAITSSGSAGTATVT